MAYRSPPITQVILALQFNTLPSLDNLKFGRIAGLLKEEFPLESMAPARPSQFEIFVGSGNNFAHSRMSMNSLKTVSRKIPRNTEKCLHLSDTDKVLHLFLQSDQVVLLWDRRAQDTVYPGFKKLHSQFQKYLKRIVDYLKLEDIGPLEINQGEVIHYNAIHITDQYSTTPAQDIVKVLPSFLPNNVLRQEVVQGGAQEAFLDEKTQQPFGRLYVNAIWAAGSDISLNLASRGKPRSTDYLEGLKFLNTLHRYNAIAFEQVVHENTKKEFK